MQVLKDPQLFLYGLDRQRCLACDSSRQFKGRCFQFVAVDQTIDHAEALGTGPSIDLIAQVTKGFS